MPRIRKAKVKFLSLCPKGANRLPTIYKSDKDGNAPFRMETLVKEGENFAERGELLSIVYVPDQVDSDGDFASAEVIKEVMYESAREGLKLDIRHNEEPISKEDAFIAESFIIQKDDPRFADLKDYEGNSVDPTGGWATVIKIESDELKKKYREGEWSGISMGGQALMEKTDDHPSSNSVLKALGKLLGLSHSTQNESDLDMTEAEIQKLMKQNNDSLTKSIVGGFAQVMGKEVDDNGKLIEKSDDKTKSKSKKDGGDDGDAYAFTGEPTVENIRKHRLKVRKQRVLDDTDWSDDEAAKKAEEELTKIEKEEKDAEGSQDKGGDKTDPDRFREDGTEKSAREIELEKELANLRKSSDQPANNGGGSDDAYAGLTKEQREQCSAADSIAKVANESRGFADAK